MKCSDYEAMIQAWARNGMAESSSEPFLAHAAACHRCTTRLAQERALTYGVRAVMTAIESDEPSPQVEVALLNALNEHFSENAAVKLAPSLAQKPPRLMICVKPLQSISSRSFKLAFGLAAALALVSFSSLLWLRSHPVTSETLADSKRETIAPDDGATAAVAPVTADDAAQRHKFVSRQRSKSAPRSIVKHQQAITAHTTEEVTEFFPLADGEDLTSFDAAQIARVELPVSALMELGLRIGPEMSAGQVKADILIGFDGSPRAIRFVR